MELVTSGCSFSFGVGNNYEKTFTGILAKNLSLRAANISVPGTGTLSAFLRSKRYVALRPRVVVYGLIEDHLLRNVYPCALFGGGICRPNVYLEWENGDWKNKIRSELWNERWIEGAEQMTLSHPFGWKDLAWVFELDWQALWRRDANGVNAAALSRLPSDGQAKAMTWAVQAWQRLAEEEGFELVVVFIPSMSKPNTLPPVIARVFESLAGRSHLHFLDTSPYFLRHRLAHPECEEEVLKLADYIGSTSGLLKSWGCQVVAASSYAAALAQLSALGRRPDFIVCDYHLSEDATFDDRCFWSF